GGVGGLVPCPPTCAWLSRCSRRILEAHRSGTRATPLGGLILGAGHGGPGPATGPVGVPPDPARVTPGASDTGKVASASTVRDRLGHRDEAPAASVGSGDVDGPHQVAVADQPAVRAAKA